MDIEGIPVYSYGKVSSTMDLAEQYAGKGKTVLVTAEEQSTGRGRYGRRWSSLPGGLYFSIVSTEEEGFPVSELVSSTIIKTLQFFRINCKIKLPNDIMKDGKKIAGILIVKKRKVYITGIGININNETGDTAERISMKEVLGSFVEKKLVLERFVILFLANRKMFTENLQSSLTEWRTYLIK